ncbi:MAG: ADP-glyceromanno-heptose 6-epimerase [Ignavibacteriae bacterium]|nr:ADP-glyceromanno-heptose 6-epimerase [Ignavibacteriota bacterium]MCB9242677.1 ADP-glyceromanno-heptose 6-epimerase [Ignavibacteriales bacterium]
MIIVTGGAGFIGSAIVWKLNQMGRDDIIIVDRFGEDDKWQNLVGLKFTDVFDSEAFLEYLTHDFLEKAEIDTIFHMGAISTTTEKNFDNLLRNNYELTKLLCNQSLQNGVRFIYASSAATYGAGENGYKDDESEIYKLRPLNGYGYSKQMFDQWAHHHRILDKIVGLKYFNVFGPNEYHKGDMRSVIHKSYEQIKSTGVARLFKSTVEGLDDGEQKRDFIYIKDAVDMTVNFMDNRIVNGLYNIGTGNATSFNAFVNAIFKSLDMEPNIEYYDMPDELVDKYQNFTQADMTKLKDTGYNLKTTPIDEAVGDYVKNYLDTDNQYLH